jgi:hypothetical protein
MNLLKMKIKQTEMAITKAKNREDTTILFNEIAE